LELLKTSSDFEEKREGVLKMNDKLITAILTLFDLKLTVYEGI